MDPRLLLNFQKQVRTCELEVRRTEPPESSARELVPDGDELRDREVDVVEGVGRRELRADARLHRAARPGTRS